METNIQIDKKEIKAILVKLLEAYTVEVDNGNPLGLCTIVKSKMEYKSYRLFRRYLKSTLLKTHKFYDSEGNFTDDDSKFVWKKFDTESRFKWLFEHIKLNS